MVPDSRTNADITARSDVFFDTEEFLSLFFIIKEADAVCTEERLE